MLPPDWAQQLTRQVCRNYRRPYPPKFFWRLRSKRISSGGSARSHQVDGGDVLVTAGTLFEDQVITLLHELAHYLLPEVSKHSDEFWVFAWKLYRRYLPKMKISLLWAVASESRNGSVTMLASMAACFETRGHR